MTVLGDGRESDRPPTERRYIGGPDPSLVLALRGHQRAYPPDAGPYGLALREAERRLARRLRETAEEPAR